MAGFFKYITIYLLVREEMVGYMVSCWWDSVAQENGDHMLGAL